ncbi:MAG TPA: hypothetical protein VFF96_01315, partial [Pseudoxanthomonas sp.]|nr:hypothetical protein [Pseudoxanthomonas sp.]
CIEAEAALPVAGADAGTVAQAASDSSKDRHRAFRNDIGTLRQQRKRTASAIRDAIFMSLRHEQIDRRHGAGGANGYRCK